MKLVICLGNPGSKYANTRHNIGFMFADVLSSKISANFSNESKFKAEIAKGTYKDEAIWLVKPQTFMNLSGEALLALRNFYKIDINTEADLYKLNKVKTNAVVSVKCADNCIEKARETIAANANILDSRIILIKTFSQTETDIVDISDLTVDQCVKFAECCREKIENTPILEAELAEILK